MPPATAPERESPRRRSRARALVEIAAIVAIFLGVRAYQQRGAAEGAAPDFTAATLDGGTTSLDAFRGRPVVLHFWASWCGVCRAMEDNVDAVGTGGVPLVRIATRSGSSADVRAHLSSRGLDVSRPALRRVLLDPDGALAARYGVRAFPTTFWIDAAGRIRHVEVGYTTAAGLGARAWWMSAL